MFFLKSLQWRLVSIFIAFAIVLIIIMGVVLNIKVQSSYYVPFRNSIEAGFKACYDNWGWDVKSEDGMRNVSIYDVVAKMRDYSKVYFYLTSSNRTYTILTKNADAIIDSIDKNKDNTSNFLAEILASANVRSVMAGNTVGDSGNLTDTGGRAFFDYAQLLRLKEGDYILYFRYDREEWKDTINSFNKSILTSIIVAIIASFILGYILSKTITVPIVSIMHKARGIADGNFDQVLPVRSHDEIGELTNTFNYMARELKNTMIQISSEKNKFETLLHYMTDGVVAFDLRGTMIHINPAAREMLQIEDENMIFNDFSKKYGFDITLEDILYLGLSGNREKSITVGDRFVNAYFALYADREKNIEGIVVVIQDNTERWKVEKMRKEFIENVSHELKTPLHTIKWYSETLLDGALEDREMADKFLSVIVSEADRMTRLVRDLLQLSSLDNIREYGSASRYKLKLKRLSFEKLVKNCVERMRGEALNKRQQLECFVIGDIPDITADQDRIEQVVLNILSNAIKYTPEEGKITVYIGSLYNEVYVKVVDTGIGIPEADLPRVFERFYRVDKARSREMGGTGLGLAIAKEIVEIHGGSISIKSEIDKGTEIIVKLPVVTEN